jgi:hypothetical protein
VTKRSLEFKRILVFIAAFALILVAVLAVVFVA